jgi:hypothetical protein
MKYKELNLLLSTLFRSLLEAEGIMSLLYAHETWYLYSRGVFLTSIETKDDLIDRLGETLEELDFPPKGRKVIQLGLNTDRTCRLEVQACPIDSKPFYFLIGKPLNDYEKLIRLEKNFE